MYQVEAVRTQVDTVIRHMDVKPVPNVDIEMIGTSDSGVPWFSVNIEVDWNVNRFKKEIENTVADSLECNGNFGFKDGKYYRVPCCYKATVTANYAPQGLEV